MSGPLSLDAMGRGMLDAVDAPVAISAAGRVVYANPSFARLAGIPIDEVLGKALATLVPAGAVACGTRAVAIGGVDFVVSTFAPEADSRWPRGRQYRELFEEDTSARFVVSPDWHVLDGNITCASMLGFEDRSLLVGRHLLEISPDAPILHKLLAVARVDGASGPSELRLERADGTLIDVSCSLAASFDDAGVLTAVRGQLVEVSERKRLETRLQGAERMEVIGRLAGGLAHDFNNLLTVIGGNSDRLIESLPDDSPLKGAALSIHEASARAASMTRQLLAYGRRQVFELQPLSIQRLVADITPLLVEILGDHVSVRASVPRDLPQISADPRQIEQVMANLAHNAREAMPSGGTLTIAVDTIDVGAHAPRERQWLRPGRYVRLVVADTGHGLDPVARAHAFQPFFTTKKMGNGRGLGLATVYGIVKQSNGFVWVESEAGRGAAFTLLFPALTSGSGDGPRAGAPSMTETVMVVDEDATFRSFARDMLTRRGYQVLTAGSGADAVRMFASHPSRIHLVIAEAGAVTTEGSPLVARLKAVDPLLQSLVTIDGADRAAPGPGVLPTTPTIEKPFTLWALARRVRDVLDSGEGRG